MQDILSLIPIQKFYIVTNKAIATIIPK